MRAFLLSFLFGFGFVGQVGAQSPVEPEAAGVSAEPAYGEAIRTAVAHYSAGRWREAQLAFARAHALQPSARTQRGLGLAAFYRGQYAAAREAFEQALADTRRPLPDEQRHELATLMRSAARESGRFELHVTPASAWVELDGEVTERRVLFLERGAHVLSVRAAGHAAQRSELHVIGGEDRTLMLTLSPVATSAPGLGHLPPLAVPIRSSAAAASDQPSSATTGSTAPALRGGASSAPPPARPARSGRVFTWVALTAVPVFAGTAAAVWFGGESKRDRIENDCERDECDEAEAARRWDDAGLDAHETWTHVSLVAAGAALVAATVLFVVEGSEASGDAIAVGGTRSGVGLSGRF